ncbi:MAG: tetratricopeptide repeat protein, partial [Chloroflexota bacterium]
MSGRQDIFQQAMNQGHSAAWDQAWDKAAAYYRQALAEFPDNPQALTSLGLALIELQEHDQALQCYQRAARTMPDDPLPMEKIAQLCERMGQLELAVQASLRGADLYLKNRDAGKAIENWERVTRLNPENMLAHTRLAMVLERMGEKDRSVSEYIAVASLLQANGELDKAVQAVQQALRVQPGSVEAAQALGMLKDFQPLPRPARPKGGTAPLRMSQVRQLQAPVDADQPELDPISMARQKALTILAGMLFEGSEDDEHNRRNLQSIVTGATGMLQRPVDRSKMVLHLSQVVDLQTRGEYNQAAEELQRAMEAGLENAAAYFDLGYLYAQSGRMESAIRHLQPAVKHHDFSLATRLLLGDMLRKKSMLKEASFEYLEALKLADSQVVLPDQANDLI